MTKNKNSAKQSADQSATRVNSEVLRALGLAVTHIGVYGADHKVTQQAAEQAHKLVANYHTSVGPLEVNLSDEGFVVGGTTITENVSSMRPIWNKMVALGVGNLTVQPGISQREFSMLVELLALPPHRLPAGQTFQSVLRELDMPHVVSEDVVYKRIASDQLVIDREGEQHAEAETGASAGIQQIVAFLRGAAESEAGEKTEGGNAASAIANGELNADRLADLILKATELSLHSADTAAGESFADILAGCLRRATNAINQRPENRSQTGKRKARKSLMLLEKALLDKLTAFAEYESKDKAVDLVTETIESVEEDLQSEEIVAQYIKRRKLAEESDRRILRHVQHLLKHHDDAGALKHKLLAAGLSSEGWEQLIISSGSYKPQPSQMTDEVRELAILMSRLEEALQVTKSSAKATDAPGMTAALGEVAGGVAAITKSTEKKIEAFGEAARSFSEDIGSAPKVSRTRLLHLVAEISQELRQPLTVVNMTVELIKQKRAGGISDAQSNLLSLVAESGRRLDSLIERLEELSGLPTTLGPNAEHLKAQLF